jgi:hypothetical protein
MDVDCDRSRPDRLRSPDVVLGEFVGQHQSGPVEVELSMSDTAARFGEAEFLFGAESLPVKLDRLRRIIDVQVGK